MKTRAQDILWGGLAIVIGAVVIVALGWLLFDRNRAAQTLIAVIPGAVIMAGAWRRTKWGAPDDGLRAHQETQASHRRSGERIDS